MFLLRAENTVEPTSSSAAEQSVDATSSPGQAEIDARRITQQQQQQLQQQQPERKVSTTKSWTDDKALGHGDVIELAKEEAEFFEVILCDFDCNFVLFARYNQLHP